MEQLLYLTDLFDFYGALLTEKQQECLRMHLFEDFALSEIGEELGISRQAVHDNIHRAQKSMEEYERCSAFAGNAWSSAGFMKRLTL